MIRNVSAAGHNGTYMREGSQREECSSNNKQQSPYHKPDVFLSILSVNS